MDNRYFIIDFDSTLVSVEGLDALAKISLKENPHKSEILEKIKEITKEGMTGRMGFRESLEKRLELMDFGLPEIEKTVKFLKKKITLSVLRNKKFFKQYRDRIFVISGGFEELIFPVVKELSIKSEHILANRFLIDKKGKFSGFDRERLTSQAQGKAAAVASLGLKGEVIVIGDGFTDLEIKRLGAASKFIAFTENVYRESIVKDADGVVRDFDEFLFLERITSGVSYPKSRMKVLLLENIESAAASNFAAEGYQVETLKSALSEEELSGKIKDVSVLGIRSKTKVTAGVFKNAKKLKCIGAFSIGTDQIDLEVAAQAGVCVFNAPFQNTRSVVELALGEMIVLMRGVFEKSNKAHSGIWDKSAKNSNEIRGKTLGIIGYGNIGSQLSVLAEGLGMEVVFYDKAEKLALGNAKKALTLDELLKKADVVTVHVSGDKKLNTNFIGEKEFSKMRDGVIFLNLARGFVVDVKALVKYIKSGKIRGAGVDVFPNEPKGKDDPLITELAGLPNTILTPHIAGSTEEAQRNIANFVSGKLIDFINSGNTYLSVNFPNINLPEQGKSHRLLHLHKNIPGVLSAINKILADSGINVLGQYLKTDEGIGYVITDVNRAYDKNVVEKLEKIEGTISLRVLY
jgi:D-3-phosphoglycerate dehydrogenase / 2-oxoglutarate reductase